MAAGAQLNTNPFANAVPANATTVDQLYGALYGLSWKGIGLPYTTMRLSLRQDLAIHKFADRDGAHVESTGRAPLQIEATCPFINQIGKGANETWSQPLYPTQYRAFLTACTDRESGQLTHPELGNIRCKLVSMDTTWVGTARGGPEVHVVWIETDDSGVDLTEDLAAPSPLATLAGACSNLDTFIYENPQGTQIVPAMPTFQNTFTDLVNSVRAVVDLPSALSSSVQGNINNILQQTKQVEATLATAPNALQWPITQQCELAKASAYDTQATLLTTTKPVATYRVVRGSTWPMLADLLNTDLSQLMTLNLSLVGKSIVPQGTVIRYYAAAA